MNPEKRVLLPTPAFRSFASRFQTPQIQEGFEEVIDVDFHVGLTLLVAQSLIESRPFGSGLDYVWKTQLMHSIILVRR